MEHAIMNSLQKRGLRQTLVNIPVIGPAAKKVYRAIVPKQPELQFRSSPQYWNDRYSLGGNSGAGSYGRLALFKAQVVNQFVAEHGIQTIVELGSGDGAQLEIAKYPHYTGIDVSMEAIQKCRARFANDSSKSFFHMSSAEADTAKAELSLSLDVIYHLIEDDIYHAYMSRLVSASERFLCIYSSNDERSSPAAHVRHRCFTDWMKHHAPSWKLISKVPNLYPEDPERPNDTSWADFYFFCKEADD
jgi:SAM-dependent methyltransferase